MRRALLAVLVTGLLGAAITLDDISVLANVTVQSGDEIEQFVAQHRSRQSAAKP